MMINKNLDFEMGACGLVCLSNYSNQPWSFYFFLLYFKSESNFVLMMNCSRRQKLSWGMLGYIHLGKSKVGRRNQRAKYSMYCGNFLPAVTYTNSTIILLFIYLELKLKLLFMLKIKLEKYSIFYFSKT